MRPSPKSLLAVLALGVVLLGLWAHMYYTTEQKKICLEQCAPVPSVETGTSPTDAYYTALEKNCCWDQGCLVSVAHMKEIGAMLMPESNRCNKTPEDKDQAVNRCPFGLKPNSLLSLGSYTWCDK